MKSIRFIKDWALPISMFVGALAYFATASIGFSVTTKTLILKGISIVQPVLIFLMLFITFCKVQLSEILHLQRWHFAGLIFQTGLFCLLAALSCFAGHGWKIVLEGAMLCLICPTATAAAVVTTKLGGNTSHITSYIILINIATALVVSCVVPIVHPQDGMNFATDFSLITARVAPMLLMPIVAAAIVQRCYPEVRTLLHRFPDIAFYLWCVSLSLAIAVTVRSIVICHYPVIYEVGLCVVSAICCCVQFAFGHCLGRHNRKDTITAGQALGQKNTVFAIWMGYTFLDPVTSVVGGFYSVWHNIYNSWQLKTARR